MQTILYVVPSLSQCGPIKVLYNLVSHLDRSRFCPVIVALSDNRFTYRSIQGDFENLDVEVHNYEYSKWQCQLHTGSIAKRIDKEFDDASIVMHAHGYYPTVILSHLHSRHTMTTIHNICDEDFRMSKGRWLGGYMIWKYKMALRSIKTCVAISDYMREHYGKNRMLNLKTVYNGVEIPPKTRMEERKSTRQKLKIEPETFVLFYPAAFTIGKNHVYLIEEIRARPELPIIIFLAGAGCTETDCRRLAATDKRIRFLGFQMNLDDWWLAADALVSPSVSEGMPMAVLEAVVRGLPCLLSTIPPHLEIAQNVFGTKEWCFDTNRKGALGSLIAKAAKTKFEKENIAAQAALHYGAEVMCRGYEELYSLCGK